MTAFHFSTPGKRLRAIRAYCAPARNSFCKNTGISESTLKAWENDVALLSRKGAALISSLLRKRGVYCTEDWLLKGEGLPPVRQVHDASNQNLSEEKVILQEFETLKHHYQRELVLLQIKDQLMRPHFCLSDFVAGAFLDKEYWPYFLDEYVVVELGKGTPLMVRKLTRGGAPGFFTLVCTNPKGEEASEPLYDVIPHNVYQILWHRRKISETAALYESARRATL